MFPWTDADIEKCVLGTALISREAARSVSSLLTPDHFQDARNRTVWEAIRQVLDEGRLPDAPMVGRQITKAGHVDVFSGGALGHYPYLGELQSKHGAAANIKTYLLELDQASVESRRKKVSQAIAAGDMDTQAATDALSEIEAGLLLDGAGEDAAAHLVELTRRQEHAEEMARQGRLFSGLDTGFGAFNRRIDGIRPGEITVLGASNSIGKTTLALQIAINLMQRESAPVGLFSLEMTAVQVAERATCILADCNPFALLRNGMRPDSPQYQRVAQQYQDAKVREWAPLPFTGYYSQSTLAEIRHTLLVEHRRHPRPLWIIDHLHQMNLAPLSSKRHEQLGLAVKEFSRLTKDLNIHILLLAQLNRNFKNRNDYRPQLSDLREAGGIEEGVDNAVLIYRPGHYPELCRAHEGDPDVFQRYVSLQFEKARHLGRGEEEISWVPDKAIYANVAPVSLEPHRDPLPSPYDREAEWEVMK